MSRLRSSRASKAGSSSRSAVAPRQRGVLVQAPKSDIYVALLGIALAAILIATVLMVVILWKYEWKISVASATSSSPASALSPTSVQLASVPTVSLRSTA